MNITVGNEKNILFYNDEELNENITCAKIAHMGNDEELNKEATCSKMKQVQIEGTRKVKRQKEYYNLDMIISIGFRVNSKKAIKFRTWANKIIKDYMIQIRNLFLILINY